MKLENGVCPLITAHTKTELKAKLREEVKDGNGMIWSSFERARLFNPDFDKGDMKEHYAVQITTYKGPNHCGIDQNVNAVDYLVKSLGYEDKDGKFLRD